MPIVQLSGKPVGLLAGPLGVHRIGRLEQRQVALALAGARPLAGGRQQQLGRIAGRALHAAARGLVVAVDLRGVPPRRHGVARGLVGPARGGPCRRAVKRGRRRRSRRRSAGSMRSPGRQPAVAVRAAAPTSGPGRVVPLLQMREPVVGHELDPERGEHVEERRLLVVAAGVGRRARQAVALAALLGLATAGGVNSRRLITCGIGLEQAEAVAVPVARELRPGRARGTSPRTARCARTAVAPSPSAGS